METTNPTYALVFPGQGSQFAGMADPWSTHPAGKRVLEEASESMGRDIVAGCHDEAALARTEFVQPALLACGVAAFQVLLAEGLSPASIVGAADPRVPGRALGPVGPPGGGPVRSLPLLLFCGAR
jgi:(acyl-carrier-protein) S-malonyltransferase